MDKQENVENSRVTYFRSVIGLTDRKPLSLSRGSLTLMESWLRSPERR